MLTNPTIDMLRDLGLTGMASAYQELEAQPEARHLEHGEWLALLLEREATTRRQKRFEARARAARLRHDAQIENIDFRAARGLDRNLFLKLANCDWIRQHHSLLLIGPAGVGKSWLACALGHKACREDFSVAYHRLPRLFATLALARGDGRYPKVLKALARTDLLILDDWGPEKLNDEQQHLPDHPLGLLGMAVSLGVGDALIEQPDVLGSQTRSFAQRSAVPGMGLARSDGESAPAAEERP